MVRGRRSDCPWKRERDPLLRGPGLYGPRRWRQVGAPGGRALPAADSRARAAGAQLFREPVKDVFDEFVLEIEEAFFGGPPVASGVFRARGDGDDGCGGATFEGFVKQPVDATRVEGIVGDDEGAGLVEGNPVADGTGFISGGSDLVADGEDGGFRDAFCDQRAAREFLFSRCETELGGGAGFHIEDDHLGCATLVVKFGGGEGTVLQATAKHDDGIGGGGAVIDDPEIRRSAQERSTEEEEQQGKHRQRCEADGEALENAGHGERRRRE